MNWQKAMVVMAILTLWLAATNHCRLESVPAFQFLVCCEHQDEAPHQDSDCETDACALVESGLYKTQNSRVTVDVPMSLVAFLFSSLSDPEPDSETLSGLCLDTAPPELPRVWQFAHRAALPARAPSLVS